MQDRCSARSRIESASAFLDGLNVASLSLMAGVTIQFMNNALVDTITISLAIVGAILLVRYRVNSVWLAIIGATVGVVEKFFAA